MISIRGNTPQAATEIAIRRELHNNAQHALIKERLVVVRDVQMLDFAQQSRLVQRVLPLLVTHAAQSHALRDEHLAVCVPFN